MKREARQEDRVRQIVREVLGKEAGSVIPMKEGMTNDSFLVKCVGGWNLVVRLNGSGANPLISRERERMTYERIEPLGIADEVLAMEADREGYKVARYIEGGRLCAADKPADVERAVRFLRDFHEKEIEVSYSFDVFEAISLQEQYAGERVATLPDYEKVRREVLSLRQEIAALPEKHTLCHIDANADNFLFAGERTYLIDWEYAAMGDAYLDLAMFGIYSGYGADGFAYLLKVYEREENPMLLGKVLAYAATGGLLWSLWCLCKEQAGIHYGPYKLQQYRYAQEMPALARTCWRRT